MLYENLTNAELVRMVDNLPNATPIMRELANRLDRAAQQEQAKKQDPSQMELFKDEA
jgi:heme exporter protein D